MAGIRHEVEIEATAEQVWDAVRDVDAVHRRLVPGLAVGARVDGDVRIVAFPDGHLVRELIVDVDDQARRLAYAVVEGRMPLVHHHATSPRGRRAAGSSGSPTSCPMRWRRRSVCGLNEGFRS